MHSNSREWEYITKIAETGSFSTAAEKLFISQPSLSQFIRRIEKHMGQRCLNAAEVVSS